MPQLDPSDISCWADQPDAFHQLPVLIRRLIMATVPELSRLDMPSGSAVWQPGWDGLITANTPNAWVPEGDSAWEFSCRSDIGAKANEDFRKRTYSPQGVPDAATTFAFVTPRRWPGKCQWAEQRRAEGHWADVRVFDAVDISAWLELAPAVAEWFASIIGKGPSGGYSTLDEWWENWATASHPNVSPALVIAGRQDSVARVAEWIQQPAASYYVKARTREEAIAFVAASALSSDDAWVASLLAKAIVVKSEDAWNSWVRHTSPLVLIRFFVGHVSPQVATNRGHHVITPLHINEDTGGNGIELPRLGRDETVTALIEMGLNETRARALTRRTARNLPIMRRSLIDEAGGPTPEWSAVDPQNPLPLLALIGQWDEANENDRASVAAITDRPYEEVARVVAALGQSEDSPLTKVGSRWRFLSHEEAWHLLAPRLTAVDVARFEEGAVRVFEAESTAYGLPVEERPYAGIRGEGVPHSGLLREGIARTLALMGNRGDRARNVEGVPSLPGKVLQRVLTGDKGWQIWATLDRDLPILAEAAPEAVLGAIDRSLAATPSPFEALFAQEGDPIFVGAPHTGLLWALERLAWAPEYFARVANALARLDLMDPGGRIANRPASSLAEMFLPWFRLSEAPDADRLTALGTLLNRNPQSGWNTLLRAHRSSNVTERQPPFWRPWGQDAMQQPTRAERDAFVEELERLVLFHLVDDIERWKDILGIIANLPPDTRRRVLTLLEQRTDEIRQHPSSSELWKALRMELNRHRSHPEAQRAMPTDDLDALYAVYQELTPDDPTAAHAWLFDGYPYLPEENSYQTADDVNRVEAARQSAIATAYERGGTATVLSLAELSTQPAAVGQAFAAEFGTGPALQLAIEHLGSENRARRETALGIIRMLFRQCGWPVMEDAIARLRENDAQPGAVGEVFLAAPPTTDTWERLDVEAPEAQRTYWQEMNPWGVSGEEDITRVAEELLAVQRSVIVAQWTTSLPVHHEIVIRTLGQLPDDLMKEPVLSWDTNMFIYSIVKLLEKLDASDDVGDDIIANLEVPFISALSWGQRPNLAIYRVIAKEPSVFAELIASGHRSRDGQTETRNDQPPSPVTAELLTQVISGHGEIPGRLDDGTVDFEGLSNWVKEARRLCSERGRGVIGDIYIGNLLVKAPTGEDGIWPCEPVRELLDTIGSQDIGEGFVTGKISLGNPTSRGIFEGGNQEHDLAAHYLKEADAIGSKWPFTALSLRAIAQWYQQIARWHDREADERDQFDA